MTSRTQIKTNNGFKISVQTEDKHNPSSITIKLLTWLTPTDEQDYSKAILKTSKRLKSVMFKTINKSLFQPDRTILFIDTAPLLMNVDKASYAQFNIVLYQNKPFHLMSSKIMKNELNEIANLMMNELITKNEFTFSKTKQ